MSGEDLAGTLNAVVQRLERLERRNFSDVVAYKFGTSNPLALTSTPGLVLALNVVHLKAANLYRLELFCRAAVASVDGYIRFTYTSGTTAGWTSGLDAYAKVTTVPYALAPVSALATVTADGSYNIGVQAAAVSGTASLWTDIGGYMLIEDLGVNRGLQ